MSEFEAVVRALYGALRERDPAAVVALVDAHFAEDVVLEEPSSLPWGGRHEGRERVGRIFAGLASAPAGRSPLDPQTMAVTGAAAGAADVAVQLSFMATLPGREPVSTGAIEWFTFRGDRVVAVRAAYFDTAIFAP